MFNFLLVVLWLGVASQPTTGDVPSRSVTTTELPDGTSVLIIGGEHFLAETPDGKIYSNLPEPAAMKVDFF